MVNDSSLFAYTAVMCWIESKKSIRFGKSNRIELEYFFLNRNALVVTWLKWLAIIIIVLEGVQVPFQMITVLFPINSSPDLTVFLSMWTVFMIIVVIGWRALQWAWPSPLMLRDPVHASTLNCGPGCSTVRSQIRLDRPLVVAVPLGDDWWLLVKGNEQFHSCIQQWLVAVCCVVETCTEPRSSYVRSSSLPRHLSQCWWCKRYRFQLIDFHLFIKPGFHYLSWQPELTARELGCIFWHQSWQPELTGVKNAPEWMGRELG